MIRLRLTHTGPWRVPPECWSSWHQCFRRQWQWQRGRPQFLPADQILQRKQRGQTGNQDGGQTGAQDGVRLGLRTGSDWGSGRGQTGGQEGGHTGSRQGSDWGSGQGSEWDIHNVRLAGTHVGPLRTANTW